MFIFSNIFKKHKLSFTSLLSLLSHLLVVLIFFILYRRALKKDDFINFPDKSNPENFNLQRKKYENFEFNDLNIFYFTVVTHSTLGFGDIVPVSNKAKRLVTFHVVIVILLVAFFGSN